MDTITEALNELSGSMLQLHGKAHPETQTINTIHQDYEEEKPPPNNILLESVEHALAAQEEYEASTWPNGIPALAEASKDDAIAMELCARCRNAIDFIRETVDVSGWDIVIPLMAHNLHAHTMELCGDDTELAKARALIEQATTREERRTRTFDFARLAKKISAQESMSGGLGEGALGRQGLVSAINSIADDLIILTERGPDSGPQLTQHERARIVSSAELFARHVAKTHPQMSAEIRDELEDVVNVQDDIRSAARWMLGVVRIATGFCDDMKSVFLTENLFDAYRVISRELVR